MKIFIVQLLMMFIFCLVVIELLQYAWRSRNPLNPREIERKIKTFSFTEYDLKSTDIVMKRILSEIPSLNKFLSSIPLAKRLDLLVQQANPPYPLSVFILLSLVLAVAGFLIIFLITRFYPIAIISAAVLGSIPFVYLSLRKQKRMQKFEKQLPETLELIARALRAGHAFTSGMQLVVENFDDPISTEFNRTLGEINFGLSVTDALRNLAERVDCPDLKYFVVSAILQRETGGNLAEIIESIARVIRERMKFKDKVQVLSAEGRLSAIILCCLPFLVVIALLFTSPQYITTLFTEPAGRQIATIAVVMMLVGILVMKKLIKIEV